MAKYLDATGLTYLWGKITGAFQAKVTASGILKGDGSGGVTAATAGTDYAAASHNQALSTITGAEDIQAIEALSGTSGLLKKTAANTWALDTNAYITGYTETDPTVPAWAKAPSKPSYTASEVGALPSTTVIPAYTSQLINNSGYITGYTETDPKVNRTTAVNVSDGNYTTYMARGEALNSADSNPSANGCISWTYG